MLAADSGLVAGALAPAADRTLRVRVVRPFLIAAVRHEREEVLDIDWRLATELVTAQKVVLAIDDDAAQPTPQPASGEPDAAPVANAPSLPAAEAPEPRVEKEEDERP